MSKNNVLLGKKTKLRLKLDGLTFKVDGALEVDVVSPDPPKPMGSL